MKWGVGAVVGVLLLGAAGGAAAAPGGGVVPEGLWVLDVQRSKELQPGAQTLWIIKDDGRMLVWVSVGRDDRGGVHVGSYEGLYGGPPAAMTGGPMRTKISTPGLGRLHNEGVMEGVGPYHEDCTVKDAGQTFVCDGEVQAAAGPQRWHDHFVLAGPSPGG